MGEQEFERYLRDMHIFQGEMNTRANSIALLLETILEKILVSAPKMLGYKISKFEECKSILSGKYTENFDELIQKLRSFNEYWKITKHGMIVLGSENLTIFKDGIHIFDQEKQDKIQIEFSQIMEALTKILDRLGKK